MAFSPLKLFFIAPDGKIRTDQPVSDQSTLSTTSTTVVPRYIVAPHNFLEAPFCPPYRRPYRRSKLPSTSTWGWHTIKGIPFSPSEQVALQPTPFCPPLP